MENWIQLSKMVPHSVLQKLLKGSACQKSALMDPYSMCTKVFRCPSWMSSCPLNGTKLFNLTLVITNVIGKNYQIPILKSSISWYWENCIYHFTLSNFRELCGENALWTWWTPIQSPGEIVVPMLANSKTVCVCDLNSCQGWGDLVVELGTTSLPSQWPWFRSVFQHLS